MDYMYVWFCGVAVITGIVFFVVLWHQWQYTVSQAEHWQTRWAAADERVNVALNRDRMMRTQLDEALDRLDRAIEQRDAATTALNEWLKKADELKAQLEERDRQFETAGGLVQSQRNKIESLEKELDGWKDSQQTWKDAASDNSRLNDALKLQATQLEQQMAELSRRKDECQQQKADLEVELQRVSDECGRWVMEYGKATTVIAAQEKNIAELRAQLDQAEKDYDILHNENHEIKGLLADKDKKCSEIRKGDQQYIDELKAAIQEMGQTIRKGDQQYIDELKAAIQEMGQTIRNKDKEIGTLRKALAPPIPDPLRYVSARDHEDRVAGYKKQIDDLIRSVAQKQKTIEEMDSQIKQNLNQIKALMEVRDNFKEQLRRKDVRVTELEKQNKQLVEARHLVFKLRDVLQIQPVLDEERTSDTNTIA